MWACMHLIRTVLKVAAAFVFLACASAPAPDRISQDIHQGVRRLRQGASEYQKGCYLKALQYVQESHERFSLVDDLQGSAASLNTLANIYYRLGDFRSALSVYDEAIALFEQLDQRSGLVRALANKSAVLIAAGSLDEASRTLDHADEISKDTYILKSLRLKTRALLRIARGDSRGAETFLVAALQIASQSEQEFLADIHYTLAQLKLIVQRPQEAVSHLQSALEIDRAAGAYFSIGLDLAALGSCYENLADFVQAVHYYKRSLKIFALLEAHPKVQWVRSRLVSCADKAGLNLEPILHWAEQWASGHNQAGLCD
jgi:tetratricopeptide (TPR) repeat protein